MERRLGSCSCGGGGGAPECFGPLTAEPAPARDSDRRNRKEQVRPSHLLFQQPDIPPSTAEGGNKSLWVVRIPLIHQMNKIIVCFIWL